MPLADHPSQALRTKMSRLRWLAFLWMVLGSSLLAQGNFMEQQTKAATAIAALPVEKGRVFLYSLDPTGGIGYSVNNDRVFHGFTILGKGEITAPDDKRILVQAFAKGIRDSKGTSANCFNPRHGLRVSIEAATYDFVICFECMSVMCHGFNGDQEILVTGGPAERFEALRAKLGLEKPSR